MNRTLKDPILNVLKYIIQTYISMCVCAVYYSFDLLSDLIFNIFLDYFNFSGNGHYNCNELI